MPGLGSGWNEFGWGEDCTANDPGYGVFGDAALAAVGTREPSTEILRALACVTRATAPSDVCGIDDSRVVDDVLPGGDGPACAGRRRCEDHTAVDAADVSSSDLRLKPCRDLPSVHRNTVNGEFSGRSLTFELRRRPVRAVRLQRRVRFTFD